MEGKKAVVDCRDRSAPDGRLRQRQRRQLEVFEAKVPGGSLHVVRTHSTSTSTSTSASSNANANANANAHAHANASSLEWTQPKDAPAHEFDSLQLSLNPLDLSSQKTKVSIGRSGSISSRRPPSRLRSTTDKTDSALEDVTTRLHKVSRLCQQIHNESTVKQSIFERECGDGSVSDHYDDKNDANSRTSSPIQNGEADHWRRSSKHRRSLQLLKQPKATTQKLDREDLETGRRLSVVLRNNNVDLDALDQILKSISTEKTSAVTGEEAVRPENKSNANKRHSFVTAESLREVRGRLKRLNLTSDDVYGRELEPDDGIEAGESTMKKEETPAASVGVSRVRSYVYGMEAMLHNRKPFVGTGSLESRSSGKLSGSSANRSEDWYNRRKSYGFEQVHNQHDQTNISLHKNKIESSTDSGICRSTEIVLVPHKNQTFIQTSKTDPEDKCFSRKTMYNKNGNSTVISVNNFSLQENDKKENHNELISMWNRRAAMNQDDFEKKTEQVTITIPITSDSSICNANKKLYHRQISDGTSVSIESSWKQEELKKRTADETKHLFRRSNVESEKEPSDGLEEDPTSNLGKRQKKVEFCKTEVHFAAESGRVNIVETDEKPPPTNNFRRRRRNSGITNNEDMNKNGLPLIHFGDTTYEKKMFGDNDNGITSQVDGLADTFNRELKTLEGFDNVFCNNTVTVSSVSVPKEHELEEKEMQESDNQPRSILKNRMIKPRPYLLGDNNEIPVKDTSHEEDGKIWGVRLRPVQKDESPMWRSTVTVQNTAYDIPLIKEEEQHLTNQHEPDTKVQLQKLVHSLRPARKSESSMENSEIDCNPATDLRRSSWSVADRVKQVEDMKWTENKGYSTKVNFGSGEATVVENNVDLHKHSDQSTWPNHEEVNDKDERKRSSILNKGLVVRIGRNDSNHTVCSKTTSHSDNNTTTTTKITIDMSPSPTNDKIPMFSAIKLPRASLHSLKSTSLIMNTFSKQEKEHVLNKHSCDNNSNANIDLSAIPEQLAALRKLYEEAADSDDSERADEEVRSYMSGGGDDSDLYETEDNTSSVVSGSWSKMRAFRNIKQHLSSSTNKHRVENEMFKNIINRQSHIKRDFPSVKTSYQASMIQSRNAETKTNISSYENAKAEPQITSISVKCNLEKRPKETLAKSPVEKKQFNSARKTFDLNKTNYTNGNLSSPSLVGSSIQKSLKNFHPKKTEPLSLKINDRKSLDEKIVPIVTKMSLPYKESNFDRKNIRKTNYRSISPTQKMDVEHNNYVTSIQSPKSSRKSGLKVSKWTENKPDLLQHFTDSREYVNLATVIKENDRNTSKLEDITQSVERPESPVYENIDEMLDGKQCTEKESSILQELTNAADQILQAVNGYTDEDSVQISTEDEDDGKKHKFKNMHRRTEVLGTISETKSWKQTTRPKTETSKNVKMCRSRVQPTSSTSSIDSISKDYKKPSTPVRQNRLEKMNEDKNRKKITNGNSEIVKATRARRLQRASSREALLQSHGSSSEDISNNVEVFRKARMIRRTKTQHSSTISSEAKKTVSQTNYVKKRECDIRRNADRIAGTTVPEIRHKTAVSTIRSTAEKAASREKAIKAKSEELRKRTTNRKDTSSSKGSNMMSQSDRSRLASGREAGSIVSAVRTSSGVYVPAYRCNSLVAISRSNSECPCLCS